MKLSLRFELIAAFTILGMISTAVIFVFVNFFLESQFKEYSIRRQESQNREIASLVEKQYEPGYSGWRANVIQEIGVKELEQGLILKVTDTRSRTIWDAVEYNSGICHSMIQSMATRMTSRYPSINGGLTYKDYPLSSAGGQVGVLRIGYYGPFFYTDADFFFIETINSILLWVALATLLASVAGGIVFSARISAPIAHAIGAAKKIQDGDFSGSVAIRSSTKEVSELVFTMNTLAKSLGEQENLRRRLTQDVAHELRTPLATLQSHLEAMIDGVWEPTKDRLTSCHSELIRLATLVTSIQTLTHYESEAFTLDKSEFDIEELGKSILCLHEPAMRAKGIAWSMTSSGDRLVYADRGRIAEVIVNLLTNAIEFTHAGGSIELRFEREKASMLIAVADTGEGIPADDLPYVFERFYRSDKSRARTHGGAGIGLAIVKQIATAHSGTVGAKSKPGVGSEFTVVLPQ
jgi:two-component system sensor histidine kinase BaeS